KTLTFKIKGVHPDKVQPVGIKLSADGKYGFVALGPANHVAVIDAKTIYVLAKTAGCIGPHGIQNEVDPFHPCQLCRRYEI
ncbi:hypothetical protein, partial [Ligilactobacillus salivarius]|uniref:hypothetical protein n=1 Tax=Ligilactobacillus salivarius TaxID=1624 RepID=UPI003C2B086A